MGLQVMGCVDGCAICGAEEGRTSTFQMREHRSRFFLVCDSCARLSEADLEGRRREKHRHRFNPLSTIKKLLTALGCFGT